MTCPRGRPCHLAWAAVALLFGIPGCCDSEAASSVRLASHQDISSTCQHALRKYLLCDAISGLFTVCATDPLLNSSALRALFDCTPDLPLEDCRRRCVEGASLVTNESVSTPCESNYQAMHSFSANLNIFTIGQIDTVANRSTEMILPMPNLKGLGGATLLSYGEPGHCAEVQNAQYCMISGVLQTGPVPSTFALGNCLPSDCTPHELRSVLQQSSLDLSLQCDLVRPVGKATGMSATLEDVLGWGGVPVYYPHKIPFSTGGAIMLGVVTLLVAFVCIGTALDWQRESKILFLDKLREADGGLAGRGLGLEAAVPLRLEAPLEPARPGGMEGFFNNWSLLRNARSLVKTRPPDKNPFACMDAIRVFSMGQVILGHTYVYVVSSTGFSNMEQFNPPNGLLGRFWFQVVPGCFYGVDSFFIMSGFLCAYGLQRKVFNRPENRRPLGFTKNYLQFVLLRYLRLIPAEMFCIALAVTLLPHMGTGILWNIERPDGHRCFDAGGGGYCTEYWWTNLLFIQDFDKYLGKCFGHTWYLANDFQMYLTAPFFALAHSIDRRLGWALLGAGLVTGVIVPMVMTANNQWVPEIIAGSSKGFFQKFYMKPWCRCPAFFLGIALGWAWPSFLERYQGRHTTCLTRTHSLAWSALGLGLCFGATFIRMAFFQCDLASCEDPNLSPVPIFWQYMWAGFGILAWCVGLGIIMILCFQNRFLPVIQGFLDSSFWQPLAKLSYSAYLIHTCVLILNYCQRDRPVDYEPSTFFFNFVAFIFCSLLAAFCLYILVEKPAANLQMKLLGGGGD